MMGNAYRNRPDVQARSIANRSNPEWRRREQVIHDTKGKLLGFFNKKELAREWFREWVSAGKPRQPEAFPEFADWLDAKRDELILRRDTRREEQRAMDVFHADWVAKGFPEGGRTIEEKLALIEVFRETGNKKVALVTMAIADCWKTYYERSLTDSPLLYPATQTLWLPSA